VPAPLCNTRPSAFEVEGIRGTLVLDVLLERYQEVVMRKTLTVGAIIAGLAFFLAPAAQAAPQGDAIVGSGAAGNGTFNINTLQKKNGKVSGTSSFQLAIGDLTGDVQFVSVSGSDACFAGSVTASTIGGVDPGQGYTVQVRDNASTGDQLQLQLGTASDSCSIGIVSPAGVTSGDISVTDSPRP
jgi:hypothetical protein